MSEAFAAVVLRRVGAGAATLGGIQSHQRQYRGLRSFNRYSLAGTVQDDEARPGPDAGRHGAARRARSAAVTAGVRHPAAQT
jgi:hypothetical protein